jgi:3-hydroxyacyl-CoA dehydrogenase
MANSKQIHNVAIVGTGVIGASWAALYLARGLNVTATDPVRDAEANLRRYIDAAWKDLTVIGLSKNASRDHLNLSRLIPNQSTVLGHAHKESIRS